MENKKQSSSLLVQALLCDDVRQEFNGKRIIIGVYGDEVVLPKLPISIPLCLWMRFKFQSSGAHSLEFVAIGERQQRLVPIISVQANVPDADKSHDVVLGGILLNIAEPEVLHFQWREGSEEWKQVLDAKMIQGPVGHQSIPEVPNVLQPLS